MRTIVKYRIFQMKWAVIVAAVAIALSACSKFLDVRLFNNTGEPMTLRSGSGSVAIDRQGSGQLRYPGPNEGWKAQVVTARCEYEYVVPQRFDHYPWPWDSSKPLKVQVEKDFSIHLLSPDTESVVSVAGLSTFQQDGFPLKPSASKCR
jgi:hypothetical protein